MLLCFRKVYPPEIQQPPWAAEILKLNKYFLKAQRPESEITNY